MTAAAPTTFCDPCKNSEQEHVPVDICLECREMYCSVCLNCHKKMKATASHSYVYLTGEETGKPCRCDSCNDENKILSSLCSECRELYCTVCTNCHRNFKATKHHVMLEISCENSETNSTAITTDLASCSLGFNDVTYSGAQVSVKQTGQDKEKPKMHTDKQDGDEATCVSLQADPSTPTALSATFLCKFSVATPSDKENVHINRMIALPDGRICVVDFDKKIKLFSESYALCDEIALKGCYAVTCLDNDTVAILVRKYKTSKGSDIVCFSVKGNKLKQTRGKTCIDGDTFDIAYRRGQFITRYQKEKTDYTCYGKNIIVKQNKKLLLGDSIHYDAVSDSVLLGNFVEHTITCYTMEGNAKWRTTLKGGPTGIVVVHGIVLVSVDIQHTLCQITMDGCLQLTPLLTEDYGITNPGAIAYQHQQCRLLVVGHKDDDVMVFNLSH